MVTVSKVMKVDGQFSFFVKKFKKDIEMIVGKPISDREATQLIASMNIMPKIYVINTRRSRRKKMADIEVRDMI